MKKNTNRNLVNTAAKNKESKPKKLGNTVVKGKKAAKIKQSVIVAAERKAVAAKKKATANRNSFRRALYRANKLIDNQNSFYKNKLTMKEFKKEYEAFGKRTGMLKGKNLDEDLKTFLYNDISSRTPKQCKSAVDNLMKHLNDAVSAYNGVEGDINKLNNTNKKYIKVLEETGSLKTEEKDGKKVYSIIEENIPNQQDLLDVNNRYLKFKRFLIESFGEKEYAEAYGS